MNAVTFQNVSYSYDAKTLALDNLSLSIPQGSFVGILGGNGSGKSTLAKSINALLLPDEGSVELFETITSDPNNLFFVRSHAGMVFQNPDDQIVSSIVEDDVAFGPENLEVPLPELAIRVTKALKTVGLEQFRYQETTALSGGQKQRVAIAGVLAMEPAVLILDEATAMLDPRGRKDLLKLCKKLNSEGFTIIFVTHFMDDITDLDYLYILQDGAIALEGTPESVLNDKDTLTQLSLELPFALQMSHALQARGLPTPNALTLPTLASGLSPLLAAFDSPQEQLEESAEHLGLCAFSPEKAEGSSALLEFKDVSFTYGNPSKKDQETTGYSADWGKDPADIWALKNISFSLYEHDFLGIAGHTGSGKSTLIQLAAHLLKPTEGEIFYKGKPLTKKLLNNSAENIIGLLFQYPEYQLFAPSVYEDVAFGPKNLGLSDDEVTKRVARALELVHLDFEEIKDKSPFTLSGGQQRRIAWAGILAMNPRTLILDEPTVGLDPKGHNDMLDLIVDLHKNNDLSIIMVSHNMDDLANLCNRLLVLDKGTIVLQGSPKAVFENETELNSLGLALPQTMKLLSLLGFDNPLNHVPSLSELADLLGAYYKKIQG